jgi:putative transposase
MVKLNDKKVKWLVDQVVEYGRKPVEVASVYDLSVRRVQQLVKMYRDTGKIPVIKENRRPKVVLTEEQKRLIEEVFGHHQVGARLLKIALDEDYPGNRISKNKIHEYLRRKGFSKQDKKKQRPRKRCRYERKHSGSLIHEDTHYCKWDRRLKLMTVIDDASRKILAAKEVSNATAQNAIKTMKQAIKEAWKYNCVIRAVNTDRGPEFFATEKGKKKRKEHEFVRYLQTQKIKHVPSRYKNPQTNGKLERWHQEYEKHRPRFNTLQDFLDWANNRIHGELRTRPNRAFINKLQPESLLGIIFK